MPCVALVTFNVLLLAEPVSLLPVVSAWVIEPVTVTSAKAGSVTVPQSKQEMIKERNTFFLVVIVDPHFQNT